MNLVLLISIAIIAGIQSIPIHDENFEKLAQEKMVFLKFFTPWCGHCKKLKPTWMAISDHYQGHKHVLMGEVDCAGKGKSLCSKYKVDAFPTLKWGRETYLTDYNGRRDFRTIKKFAIALEPKCNPIFMEVCNDEEKVFMDKFVAYETKFLISEINRVNDYLMEGQNVFLEEVDKLQKAHAEAEKEKIEKIKEITSSSGYYFMKSVLFYKQQQAEN